MPKIWVGRTTVNGEKKEDGLIASDAFPDIGSVGRIDKKNWKGNHKKSRNRRPWYPRTTLKVNIHIFGLTKYTIYCKKMFLFSPMLLLCSFFRLKELFQMKNGLTTSLLFFFFFLKMPKIWVGWTTLNGEIKEDGLRANVWEPLKWGLISGCDVLDNSKHQRWK